MIRVDTTVVINRPPDEVGRFLADIERQTDWTDMTRSRKLTDGPVRRRTVAEAEIAMGPLKLGWTWVVADFEPGANLTYRTISNNAIGMDGYFVLEPQGAASARVRSQPGLRPRQHSRPGQ